MTVEWVHRDGVVWMKNAHDDTYHAYIDMSITVEEMSMLRSFTNRHRFQELVRTAFEKALHLVETL